MNESTKFDLSTSEGGRGYLESLFQTELKRHDFTHYIRVELAADFACALSQYIAAASARESDLLKTIRELSDRVVAANAREAALRDELAQTKDVLAIANETLGKFSDDSRVSQQRLTAAEQRNAELVELLREAMPHLDTAASAFKAVKPVRDKVRVAIKPTTEGVNHE